MRREPPALDVHASRTRGDTSGPARRLPVHWFTETQVIPLVDLGGPRPWSSQRLPALKTTPRGNRVSRDLVERLDAPILGAAQCPRVADRLHPVSRGTGKRDVHLVNDALRAPTVLLATRCSYRHLSPGSSLPESKGQPIQFCLSGLPPGKDAEVDNNAPIFGERCGELIAMDRHGTGSFPVCPGDLTLGCHRRAAASRLGRDCGRVPITPATSPGLAATFTLIPRRTPEERSARLTDARPCARPSAEGVHRLHACGVRAERLGALVAGSPPGRASRVSDGARRERREGSLPVAASPPPRHHLYLLHGRSLSGLPKAFRKIDVLLTLFGSRCRVHSARGRKCLQTQLSILPAPAPARLGVLGEPVHGSRGDCSFDCCIGLGS